MTAKVIETSRKTVHLTKEQVRWLRAQKKKHNSITDASITLGIGRDVLVRILEKHLCSERTYRKLFPSDIEDSSEDLNQKVA